MSYKLI